MTVVSPAWAVLALLVLMTLVLAASAFDGALAGRANRGASGISRPFGELGRLMRQRRRTLVKSDRPMWRIGGAGLILVAGLMVAVVPLGQWSLMELDVGVVWFNAMDVMVWALLWLTGWGANSAYSLVGGYRFLAQALGYELPLMFALVCPAIASGSLNVGQIQSAQGSLWFIVWMPVAFAIYIIGVLGFSAWGPFSPAVGTDIGGGIAAELSGVDRLLFTIGRHALLVAGAAFAVPMFLGGGAGPWLPGWVWAAIKIVAVLAGLVWLRRKLPALRPDTFMEIGWIVLLPAALVQMLVVSVVVVVVGG